MLLYNFNIKVLGLLLTFLIKVQAHEIQAKEQKYDLVYPIELVKLAESLGMEPIGGDKFWDSIITYGGQGLPYIFNVVTTAPIGKNKIPANVIFWCQKDKKKYLVYAEDNQTGVNRCNYEARLILSQAEMDGNDYNMEGSYGLVAYDDILGMDKDLSSFYYLDNPNERGPKGVYPTSSNGCLPIIMYQESSVAVLYLYKNRWLQYVEVDE